MMKLVDNLLNSITMYRLISYVLVVYLLAALLLCQFKVLPFSPVELILSALILIIVCWITNKALAKIMNIPANVESFLITALILTLIIPPAKYLNDLPLLIGAAVASQASKYFLAFRRKHIFNPAAFGVAFMSIFFKLGASWWVSVPSMLPFVILGGFLIIRKLKRFDLVLSAFIVALIAFTFTLLGKRDVLLSLQELIAYTPLVFFLSVMLTEPQTTPPKKIWRTTYGSVAGLLFALPVNIGAFFSTYEIALLVSNLYSFIVRPPKMLLKLKQKQKVAENIYNFIFKKEGEFNFLPGQYMEWTLGHNNPDNRGNRRFFTIASSPTENEIIIGVKFYQNGSSFKKALNILSENSGIMAGQLDGEFTLPKDTSKKLCFLAGGIGVTPFRSMIKYLLDLNQTRDVVLLYSTAQEGEIAYKDIFEKAKKVGVKTVYAITDKTKVSAKWKGKIGYIDFNTIKQEMPDYKDRIYYLSGPRSMVDAFIAALDKSGISKKSIKTDYFPGYA